MGLRIRIMKKQDLRPLAKVYVEVYRQFEVGEHWTFNTARKLLSYWRDRQPDLALVAEHNSKVVGGMVAGIKP